MSEGRLPPKTTVQQFLSRTGETPPLNVLGEPVGPARSDTKATNPKDAQATTRLDLTLFPMSATIYGALAMSEGDLKYGGYNYREAGVQVSVYVAALFRHVMKYYNGEWADAKTNVPHLANAIACLAVLVDSIEHGNINDDRPPFQDTAGLLARMEEHVAHLQKIFPRKVGRYRQDGKHRS